MRNLNWKNLLAALAIGALPAIPANAAAVFSGSGTNGNNANTLSASVSFDIVGGQLQVVLTNTDTTDVDIPTDVLTAVFFNVAGNPALTRVSAISGGATYLGNTLVNSAGTVVGGEWAYLNSLSQYSANSAISSTGVGIFGSGDRFPGADLSPPTSPDGLQYGIVPAGDNPATGNGGVLGNELTHDFVTFTLGYAGSFNLASIGNVTFQYGTALDEPSFGGSSSSTSSSSTSGGTSGDIPEPSSSGLVLIGLGLIGASFASRLRARPR